MRRIKMTVVMSTVVATALGMWTGLIMAQGTLAPPGAPAPTMKTLTQVEPRTPISQDGYEITIPGSYYVTTNLHAATVNCIMISTNNVTLDLNGFTLSGTGANGNGVYVVGGGKNIKVYNGIIRDCHFNGIFAGNADGCIFRNLQLLNNARAGITYYGLSAGTNSVVENCVAADNRGVGIYAKTNSKITGNEIRDNGGVGLRLTGSGSYVADNLVSGNGVNYRFDAGNKLNLMLSEIPETLSWPCSVNLAGTLTCTEPNTNGITVNADNVTIDMAGHALIGPGTSSGVGIYEDHIYSNLRIFNGKLSHWQNSLRQAVYAFGKSSVLENIQVVSNYYGIAIGPCGRITGCAAYTNSDYGIYLDAGCLISDCNASYNGGRGIYAGENNTISGCSAYHNSSTGIKASSVDTLSGCVAMYNSGLGIEAADDSTLSDCTASYNYGGNGINAGRGCTLSDCTASYNSGGAGIYAGNSSTVSGCAARHNGNEGINASGASILNCSVEYNSSDGIYIDSGGMVSDCVSRYNTANGISAASDCKLVGNNCYYNGFHAGSGAGIYISGFDNRVEGNNMTDNDWGLKIDNSGNFVVRNSASGNSTNYNISATQTIGPIVTATGTITNTNPWANFSF